MTFFIILLFLAIVLPVVINVMFIGTKTKKHQIDSVHQEAAMLVHQFQRERVSPLPYSINASIILSGVGKDIEPNFIPTLVRKLRLLGKHFRQYHIVIYENNSNQASKDAWVKALSQGANDYNFVSETIESHAGRTEAIANARNRLLGIVHEKFSSYDFQLVADLDGLCTGDPASPLVLSPKIFKKALEDFGNDWDALSFRHVPYWDRWAFREVDVMPYNMFGPNRNQNKIQDHSGMDKWMESLDATKLKPVISAFMMLAVYRIKSTLGCQYRGVDEAGMADCEHVAFHVDIAKRNNARVRLWPVGYCEDEQGKVVFSN
jgi:hypothetical protein